MSYDGSLGSAYTKAKQEGSGLGVIPIAVPHIGCTCQVVCYIIRELALTTTVLWMILIGARHTA